MTPKFAAAIVAAYQREIDAKRPIDRKLARAEFDGFCKAADSLGLAMSPTHMHMMVMDAYRSQPTPRPALSFTSSAETRATRAWDNEVAVKVYEAVLAA